MRYYCMATDKARFVGEPVAAIVARDRYIAEDALDLIEVDYEPLPAVVDPERALEPDAPRLHDEVPGNLACHRLLSYGDVDAAFAVDSPQEVGGRLASRIGRARALGRRFREGLAAGHAGSVLGRRSDEQYSRLGGALSYGIENRARTEKVHAVGELGRGPRQAR